MSITTNPSPFRNVANRSRIQGLIVAYEQAMVACERAREALRAHVVGLECVRTGDRALLGVAYRLLDSTATSLDTQSRNVDAERAPEKRYAADFSASPFPSPVLDNEETQIQLPRVVPEAEPISISTSICTLPTSSAQNVSTPQIPQTPPRLITRFYNANNADVTASPLVGAVKRKNLKRSRDDDGNNHVPTPAASSQTDCSLLPPELQKLDGLSTPGPTATLLHNRTDTTVAESPLMAAEVIKRKNLKRACIDAGDADCQVAATSPASEGPASVIDSVSRPTKIQRMAVAAPSTAPLDLPLLPLPASLPIRKRKCCKAAALQHI